jgi:hypothetical protein
MASDELLMAIARDHGVELTAQAASPLIGGYVLQGGTSARDALEPILDVTGLSLRNHAWGMELGHASRGDAVTLDPEDLAQGEGAVLRRRRGDPAEAPGRLVLSFADRERDYQTATSTASNQSGGPLEGVSTSLVLDGGGARRAAERMLDARDPRRETVELSLPWSELALEPGDLLEIAGVPEGPFEILEIRDGESRHIKARSLAVDMAIATEPDRVPLRPAGPIVRSMPLLTIAHLPPSGSDPSRSRLAMGAYAMPWPGPLDVVDETTGARVAQLSRRAKLGSTIKNFALGTVGVWDESQSLEVMLHGGHLASVPRAAVLAGSNRIAVESDTGAWEVIGFADAELIGSGLFRLSALRRGLDGTAPAMGSVSTGNRVLVLDGRMESLALDADKLGEERQFRLYAGPGDLAGTLHSVAPDPRLALPLAPSNLRAQRLAGGDVMLSWVRRSPVEGNGSSEPGGELFDVTIQGIDGPVRTFQCGSTMAVYSAAEQVADWGALPAAFTFTIAQVSGALGAGAAAEGAFP